MVGTEDVPVRMYHVVAVAGGGENPLKNLSSSLGMCWDDASQHFFWPGFPWGILMYGNIYKIIKHAPNHQAVGN